MKINVFDVDGKLVRTAREVHIQERDRETDPERPMIKARPIIEVGRTHWYYGSLEAFAVEVLDTLGQQVRVLRRAFPRERLSEIDREEVIAAVVDAARTSPEGGPAAAEQYGKTLREKGIWDEYRPFHGTIVEDAAGNAWVEHYRMLYPNFVSLNARPTAWSVFDASGTFLGEVVMPAALVATTITNDQVLGLFQDSLGVKHARAYRLIKP